MTLDGGPDQTTTTATPALSTVAARGLQIPLLTVKIHKAQHRLVKIQSQILAVW